MKVELSRTFSFSAAHRLPAAGAEHRCGAIHGHNFTVEVAVRGRSDPRTGWLMDFGDLKQAVGPLIAKLDHRVLNEIAGLENPTSENLARWIWIQLKPLVPPLHSISISETPATRCTYWGEE